MSGYTYLNSFTHDPNVQKFGVAIALGAGLLALGRVAAKKITVIGGDNHIVPSEKPKLPGLIDLFFEAFVHYHDSILGKERREFVPLCAAVFFFILASNFLGLIPGVPAITTSVWVNVGIALVVFFSFNSYGIRENGLFGYLKHFAGPVIWIAPFFFVVEIVSTLLRILTLNLRLYWNITADHLVLSAFTDMTKVVVPVVFYAMGTFVSFMQAFVFATLTMVYILFAVQHEEGDHH